jgi:AMP nucleosidase
MVFPASPEARAHALVDELEALYQQSMTRLRAALRAYLERATPPSPDSRQDGSFAYPELRVHYRPAGRVPKIPRAFAILDRAGTYATTVTRPAQFRSYLVEQLAQVFTDYEVEAEVALSRQEIPYPYVLDASLDLNAADVRAVDLARHFPATQLAHIGDELADALMAPEPGSAFPLTLFDGLRTDFSLARLRHYTGAPAESTNSSPGRVQSFAARRAPTSPSPAPAAW